MTTADELDLIVRIHAGVLELQRLAEVTLRIYARLKRRLDQARFAPKMSANDPLAGISHKRVTAGVIRPGRR